MIAHHADLRAPARCGSLYLRRSPRPPGGCHVIVVVDLQTPFAAPTASHKGQFDAINKAVAEATAATSTSGAGRTDMKDMKWGAKTCGGAPLPRSFCFGASPRGNRHCFVA